MEPRRSNQPVAQDTAVEYAVCRRSLEVTCDDGLELSFGCSTCFDEMWSGFCVTYVDEIRAICALLPDNG
jgi:hypothetical protein